MPDSVFPELLSFVLASRDTSVDSTIFTVNISFTFLAFVSLKSAPYLLWVDQIEKQGLEAMTSPILDQVLLGLVELGNGAIGPNLSELVVKCFVRHDELAKLAYQGVMAL